MHQDAIKDKDRDFLKKKLLRLGFFATISDQDFEGLLNGFSLDIYEDGETIFKQGEPGKTFYIIYQGEVDVISYILLFIPRHLATLGPGDCFGEMALIDHKPRAATVKAKGTLKVFSLYTSQFTDLFKNNVTFKDTLRAIANSRK